MAKLVNREPIAEDVANVGHDIPMSCPTFHIILPIRVILTNRMKYHGREHLKSKSQFDNEMK